jgi:protein SCO1/2
MQRRAAAILGLVLALAGCAREAAPTTYQLSGQILLIDAGTQQLVIRHGDIVGFMPGMTMPFKVRDPQLLVGRAAGDLVTATLTVEPEAAWISTLTATGHAPLPADAPTSLPAAAGVDVANIGDAVPDTPLRTSHGSVSLVAGRGRVTAVTFIYLRCPLPDYCPLMDRRFAEVQRQVKADPLLSQRVALVSVSIDPAADTPARLAEHAAALGADPAIWQFGSLDDERDIARFAAQFGVNVIRERDGTITHNLRTLVIDATGTVRQAREGNTWTADDLVDDLRQAVAGR